MTSSAETSSPLQTAIHAGLERALTGFLSEPSSTEARNAIYSALATMVEVEARRTIEQHLRVEHHDGKAVVTLGAPLAHLLRDLFGDAEIFGDLRWSYEVTLPGWSKPLPTEHIQMTRPYIDPRTNRPTRGRLVL